jgi:hypothetical protein
LTDLPGTYRLHDPYLPLLTEFRRDRLSGIGVKVMKTQAWGWLAAGVLAAGLNASYHDGGLQWAHRVADQVEHNSAAVLALASGRADLFLTEARLVTSEDETASCRWGTALARLQTKLAQARLAQTRLAQTRLAQTRLAETELAKVHTARTEREFAHAEAFSAREAAQLARLEANRARIEALVAARTARVNMQNVAFRPVSFPAVNIHDVCPRIRVNIPRLPAVHIPDGMMDIETPDIETPDIDAPGDGPI